MSTPPPTPGVVLPSGIDLIKVDGPITVPSSGFLASAKGLAIILAPGVSIKCASQECPTKHKWCIVLLLLLCIVLGSTLYMKRRV